MSMEDARALKQIGAQLNTPIEERTFTTECIKHWVSCNEGPRRFHGRGGEWKTGRNNRQMAGAKTKAQSSRTCAGAEPCANPPPAPPNFKTEQDEQEAAILQHFLLIGLCHSSNTGKALSLRLRPGQS
jgi:hypothetical protein